MESFTVLFYDLPDGTEPVREFLLSLNRKMLAKVVREIELLSVNGPELREPYSKSLATGYLSFALNWERTSPAFYISSSLGEKSSSPTAL